MDTAEDYRRDQYEDWLERNQPDPRFCPASCRCEWEFDFYQNGVIYYKLTVDGELVGDCIKEHERTCECGSEHKWERTERIAGSRYERGVELWECERCEEEVERYD